MSKLRLCFLYMQFKGKLGQWFSNHNRHFDPLKGLLKQRVADSGSLGGACELVHLLTSSWHWYCSQNHSLRNTKDIQRFPNQGHLFSQNAFLTMQDPGEQSNMVVGEDLELSSSPAYTKSTLNPQSGHA